MPCIYSCILSSFQVVVIRLVRTVNAVFMYSIFFSGIRHSVSTNSECRVSIHVFYLLFRLCNVKKRKSPSLKYDFLPLLLNSLYYFTKFIS